jgi:hypothetical protein
MVELDSYSSVDWSDSGVSHYEAEALKRSHQKPKRLAD